MAASVRVARLAGPAALLAATLVLTTARTGAAGVEFAPPVSYELAWPTSAIALGDLDGDGDLDAIAGHGNATLEIFFNRGDGVFDRGAPFGATHSDVEIANLVGDDMADLAVAYSDGKVSVYRGLGTGAFAPAFDVSLAYPASKIVSLDVDGDGLNDVAVVSSDDNSVTVLLNRGDSFAAPARYAVGGHPRSIEAGDLNGDHRSDLVTGNALGTASVLLNRGDGSFEPASSYSVYGLVSWAAIGRLDADAHADIAVVDENGTVSALINDGHGRLTSGGGTLLYGRALSATVADFDGDGNADVAVARDDLGQVIALAGRGDGTFQYPALYFAAGVNARLIASGDLNGDGRPDLVTGDGRLWRSSGSMSVLLNGAPRTCPRQDLDSGVGASGLVSADFDGDGVLDLATTNEDNTLSVLLSVGGGGFHPGRRYPLGTLSQNLSAGDLDGDGRPDLAASNYSESTVSLYYNRGNGTFEDGAMVRVGPNPRWVEVADVSGDGRPDLVTANYNGATGPGTISVLLNLGGRGSFGQPYTYAAGYGPYMVRAANLDGNEMLDLVVNNYDGQSMSVYLNQGDGTFHPQTMYAGGWNLSSAVADFDRDGDNDIAVTNFKENTVTVFRNEGAGVFGRYADIPVGRNPRSIQAAIIKGDGDFDLTVALAGMSQVLLLENDGSGHFAAVRAPCGVGVNPKTLIVADLDGNGGHDLATANAGAGTVSVLLDVSPPASAPNRISALKRPRKLESEAAPRFELAASRPNPARGEATIPFAIPRDGPVELRVYDVAGRMVRTLVHATLPAGEHEARWDGMTDGGMRASPGTYFYRLRAGDQRAARTLLMR